MQKEAESEALWPQAKEPWKMSQERQERTLPRSFWRVTATPTPWSGTSGLRNWETINPAALSHQFYGNLLQQPLETHIQNHRA